MQVYIETEVCATRLLAVNLAMNGTGRSLTVERQNLSCPARRGKEHHLLTQVDERLHHSSHQRRLARTCLTAQYHGRHRVARCQKLREYVDGIILISRRIMTEMVLYVAFKFAKRHEKVRFLFAIVLSFLYFCRQNYKLFVEFPN